MATPVIDPSKQPSQSGDDTNKDFEQVYKKVNADEINIDDIDTSGLEVATTMDATNAALLKQVEQKEVKTPPTPPTSNAIPQIQDIGAYIEATKQASKDKEKQPTQFLAMDGTDLSKLPGVYAVVPNQKGDHKVVFLRDKAPAELIDDPKNRIKGSVYQKDGADIYNVSVDMKQHTTLRNTEGKPLDVWVIDNPKDLDDQMQAIYSGKGGGTNFGMPVKITPDAQKSGSVNEVGQGKPQTKSNNESNDKSNSEPKSKDTTPKIKTPKEDAPKKEEVKEVVTKEKLPKEEKKETVAKKEVVKEETSIPPTKPTPTTPIEKAEQIKTVKDAKQTVEDAKKTVEDVEKIVTKQQPPREQTIEEVNTSMDDAWKAMKEKMHAPATPVSKPEEKTPVKKDATQKVSPTPTPKPVSKEIVKDVPVVAPIETSVAAPVQTPVETKNEIPVVTPIETPVIIPPVTPPTAPKKEVEVQVKEEKKIEKVEEKISESKKDSTPVVVIPVIETSEKVEKVGESKVEPIEIVEVPASPFPVFNIDTMGAPKKAPTPPVAPVENLVGQKSLDAEPKAAAEKAPKTIEQMLEQEAKPNLQEILATSKTPTQQPTTTPPVAPKTRKPLLALSKKRRIIILAVLVLIVGWIGIVMFGNKGSDLPTDQPVDGQTGTGEDNSDGQVVPDDTVQPSDNEQPTPNPDDANNPQPTDNEQPTPNPDEPKTTYTMAELVAKLEDLQVEARKVLNQARQIGNREAIKFSVAALQKATSTLETIEGDASFTADQAQKDATRADKYLQDAIKLLEVNAQ